MRRVVVVALLFIVGAATVAALATWHQPVEAEDDAAAIVLPERNSPEPPAIAPPPTVPAQAAQLPGLSYVVKTTWASKDGRRTTTETFTRRHDRVRMTIEDGREEWLFVQNTRYPDRASGYLIDHRARQILLHEETALRIVMGIRGWTDVLTMRFDPSMLSTLRDTGEQRSFGAAVATRFVSTDATRSGVAEVWWSEELLLPLSLTVRHPDGTATSVVQGLTTGVDEALLADADQRFPDYKSEDLVDAHDH